MFLVSLVFGDGWWWLGFLVVVWISLVFCDGWWVLMMVGFPWLVDLGFRCYYGGGDGWVSALRLSFGGCWWWVVNGGSGGNCWLCGFTGETKSKRGKWEMGSFIFIFLGTLYYFIRLYVNWGFKCIVNWASKIDKVVF